MVVDDQSCEMHRSQHLVNMDLQLPRILPRPLELDPGNLTVRCQQNPIGPTRSLLDFD
jgi:hypothetical protein